MGADWKWDGDRGERRLPDRVLRVDNDAGEWWWSIHVPWMTIGKSITPSDTRESTVEAVEKAAGVYETTDSLVAEAAQGISRERDEARAQTLVLDPPQTGLQAAVERPSAERVAAFAEAVAICEQHAAWARKEHDGANSEIELTARALRKQLYDRQKAAERSAMPAGRESGTLGVVTLTDAPAVEREAMAVGAFTSLREANMVRQREWDKDDRISLSYRGNELAGEVGEACNIIKKLDRERLGIRGSRATVEQLADELADVVICADLVALMAGIDLDAAVVQKFNASSEKVGLKTRMAIPDRDALRAENERLTRELAALTDERDDLKSQRDAMRADVPDSEQLLGTVAMTGMIQAHDAHKKQKRTEAELAEMRADLAALRRTVAEECAVACEAVGRDFGDAYKCAGACRAIGAPKERA